MYIVTQLYIQDFSTVGDLAYHLNLVELLTLCTEGKNVATEIRCHSLLPLDELVRVVKHQDCIPEVRIHVCVCCLVLDFCYNIIVEHLLSSTFTHFDRPSL